MEKIGVEEANPPYVTHMFSTEDKTLINDGNM